MAREESRGNKSFDEANAGGTENLRPVWQWGMEVGAEGRTA